MTATVPHLAFPFRVAPGGSFAVVEQDTVDEVAQNVEVVVRTPVGDRIEIPEFGSRQLIFGEVGGDDVQQVLAAVTVWEPRADVIAEDYPERLTDLIRRVRFTTSFGGE